MFRFYSNYFANATRQIAGGLFALGLLLLGLCLAVMVFKVVVVFAIAGLFFFGGLWCIFKAISIFIRLFSAGRGARSGRRVYRKNVRIHYHDNEDGIL